MENSSETMRKIKEKSFDIMVIVGINALTLAIILVIVGLIGAVVKQYGF